MAANPHFNTATMHGPLGVADAISKCRALHRHARKGTTARASIRFHRRTRDVILPSGIGLYEARLGLAVYLSFFLPALVVPIAFAALPAGLRGSLDLSWMLTIGVLFGVLSSTLGGLVLQFLHEADTPGHLRPGLARRLARAGGALTQEDAASRADALAAYLVFAARARRETSAQARLICAIADMEAACGDPVTIAITPQKPDPLLPLAFELFICRNCLSPSALDGERDWIPLLTDDFSDQRLLDGIGTCLAGTDEGAGILRWLGHATIFPSVAFGASDDDGAAAPVRFLPSDEVTGQYRAESLSGHARLKYHRLAAASG